MSKENKMKKLQQIFIIFILLFSSLLYTPGLVNAGAASLYLTPASATETIGSTFTIFVGINAGGNPTDAWKATVNFPSVLAITGAGQTSLSTLCPETPTISGNSVTFQCGAMNGSPGYGASGNVIYISVKGVAVGTGSAGMSNTQILAGPGNEVAGGASGGTYTITASNNSTGNNSGNNNNHGTTTSTAAPIVTSSTHPDQNAWYVNNDPAFSWNKASGVTGYSFVMDQVPDTVPSQSINTTGTSLSFSNEADGTWYFHIRADGPNGWSATTNYRVQIDTMPPTGLVVVTDPKGEADVRPMVSFYATDATSGIAFYQIKMDQEPYQVAVSPYLPSFITSGVHTFTVKAFDRAGNLVTGSVKITIKEIPIPKITSPKNHDILKLAESLKISGTANKDTVVDLYFDGVNIARSIKVDSKGNWNYTYQKLIFPGSHKIDAVAIKDGIESKPSNVVNIKIDPTAVSLLGIVVPTWFVFIGLLFVIGFLIFIAIWLYEYGPKPIPGRYR